MKKLLTIIFLFILPLFAWSQEEKDIESFNASLLMFETDSLQYGVWEGEQSGEGTWKISEKTHYVTYFYLDAKKLVHEAYLKSSTYYIDRDKFSFNDDMTQVYLELISDTGQFYLGLIDDNEKILKFVWKDDMDRLMTSIFHYSQAWEKIPEVKK